MLFTEGTKNERNEVFCKPKEARLKDVACGKVERSHRTDQECFYNHLKYSSYEELQEKMADWLNRYNNRPHSSLRNNAGKRVWLTPLQKRAELLAQYKAVGFKNENNEEYSIRFLKKAA